MKVERRYRASRVLPATVSRSALGSCLLFMMATFLPASLLRAGHGAKVTGAVKDSTTHVGMSGVTVLLNTQGKSGTTNSTGTYSITRVAAGQTTLTASKTGYVTRTTGTVTVPSSGRLTVGDISLVANVGTVTGTVTDAQNSNAALAGAVVKISDNLPLTATTASNGTYSIANVPTGTHGLTVSATNYRTVVTATSYVNVPLQSTVTAAQVSLSRTTVTVSGTVRTPLRSRRFRARASRFRSRAERA